MRILNFTMSHFDTPEDCVSRCEGPFGLNAWLDLTTRLFSPVDSFIACGTWSDPMFLYGRLAKVHIVNAGIERTHPHGCQFWNYSLCSWQAAFTYALGRHDWDLLVILDTDCLVGAVDFDSLFREFMDRSEEVLSPSWCGCWIGGPLCAFKRSGVSRWLNGRLRPNLIHPDSKGPAPMLPEEEMTRIYDGRWMNPWPHIDGMRQDYGEQAEAENTNEQAMTWPFVRKPHPAIIERYLTEKSPGATPVKS